MVEKVFDIYSYIFFYGSELTKLNSFFQFLGNQHSTMSIEYLFLIKAFFIYFLFRVIEYESLFKI